jgi:hypothetical protein
MTICLWVAFIDNFWGEVISFACRGHIAFQLPTFSGKLEGAA